MTATKITVETFVNANAQKTWDYWTNAAHVVHWNFASADWHCPKAESDLREGGKFSYTMASRDGQLSFDFEGIFTLVKIPDLIHYRLGDGRKVEIAFVVEGSGTRVIETFEAETQNTIDLQRFGWQAILDNFKICIEAE